MLLNRDFWQGIEVSLKAQKKSLQFQIEEIDDALEKILAIKEMEDDLDDRNRKSDRKSDRKS